MHKVRRYALLIVLLAVGVTLLRSVVVDWHQVTGHSMLPTLQPGEWFLCNKLAYGLQIPCGGGYQTRWAEPKPGEIVVFHSPLNGQRCVKRVTAPPAGQTPPKDGGVWVEGDNPQQSLDSRQIGFISHDLIEGRAFWKPVNN